MFVDDAIKWFYLITDGLLELFFIGDYCVSACLDVDVEDKLKLWVLSVK